MSMIHPRVGNWYKEVTLGNVFEVVAMDEADLTIETQLIDGELAEYDFDSWRQLQLVNIEEPEDWRSPFEIDEDEYYADDAGGYNDDWNNPLSSIESEVVNGIWDD